jgi:hypothetical protein
MHDDLLPLFARLEVAQIVIESRSSSEDVRDVRSIRNWYRDNGVRCPHLSFVDKQSPATWLSDAAAGLWADALLGRAAPLDRLVAAGRVRQATWSPGPKNASAPATPLVG